MSKAPFSYVKIKNNDLYDFIISLYLKIYD